MFTTVIAVIIGLVLVNLIKPGNSISNETRLELIEAYSRNTEEKREAANKQKSAGPLQALEDIVPDNIFKSFTSNKNMLQVIFFALFFGIGMILLPEKKVYPVKEFIDSLNTIILKLIDQLYLLQK